MRRFKSRPMRVLLLIVLPCSILIACADRIPSAAPDPSSVCSVMKPIYFDRLRDTTETIVAVKEYDAELVALCPSLDPARTRK